MDNNHIGFELNAFCTSCSKRIASFCVYPQKTSIKCPECNVEILKAKAINGFIYVLSNSLMPSLVKIGLTTRNVEERVHELNSPTGVPSPFDIESYFITNNPQEDEKKIHEKLNNYRVTDKKEFFEISPDEARTLISKFLNKNACYVNQEIKNTKTESRSSNIKLGGKNKRKKRFLCPICDSAFLATCLEDSICSDCPRCGATSFVK